MLLPLEAATCIQMLMWERPSQPVLPCPNMHVLLLAGKCPASCWKSSHNQTWCCGVLDRTDFSWQVL